MSQVYKNVALEGGSQNLRPLTGLRIIAAAWVLLHHFSGVILEQLPLLGFLKPIFDRGYLGVDLFFALSGFILTHNYLHRFGQGFHAKQYFEFVKLRLARVYPVHILTLISAAALFFVGKLLGFTQASEDSPNTLAALVQNILLVHAWFGQPYTWNEVSWSVSAEWFAYLLFPAVTILIWRVRSSVLAVFSSVTVLGVYAIYTLVVDTETHADTPDNALARISASFLAGSLLRRWCDISRVRLPHWAASLTMVLLIGLTYIEQLPSVAYTPVLVLLILFLSSEIGWVAKILSTRVFVHGGLVSYSFYMIHEQVLSVSRVILGRDMPWFVALLLILLTILAVYITASIMHAFVEEPARRYIRHFDFSNRRFAVRR